MDDDGYLYLYGCDRGTDPTYPCRVARAATDHWDDRAAYRFWDGTTWSADVGKAAPLLDDVPLELSVSYNRYLGRYIAVYTPFLSDPVIRTAARPEGPWSDPVVLFKAISPPPAVSQIMYGAKEHPEFSTDCGRNIVVTYPRNLDYKTNEIRIARVTFE